MTLTNGVAEASNQSINHEKGDGDGRWIMENGWFHRVGCAAGWGCVCECGWNPTEAQHPGDAESETSHDLI
jgi:hypothetical protein